MNHHRLNGFRNLKWSAAWLACWMFAGCGLDVIEVEVVESGSAGLAGATFPGMNQFGTSLEDALQTKDIEPGKVDSLKVVSGSLKLTSRGGVTQDLSFLEKMEFNVSAPGLETRLLASQSVFPTGRTEVQFEIDGALELKPYLDTREMSVTLEAPLVFVPPDRVDLEVRFRLRVDVNVI